MMTTKMNLIIFLGIEIDFDNFSSAFSTTEVFIIWGFPTLQANIGNIKWQVIIYNPYLVSYIPYEYTWRNMFHICHFVSGCGSGCHDEM